MTTPNPGFTTRIHPVVETPLGRLIRERRLAMGISQSQLSERLALDHSLVADGTRKVRR